MGKAEDLAARSVAKASDTLADLQREMDIMKWPAEFRSIMWMAIRDEAAARVREAEAARQAAGA